LNCKSGDKCFNCLLFSLVDYCKFC
jgi:hypothetical protein